jgi:hypothetical protein
VLIALAGLLACLVFVVMRTSQRATSSDLSRMSDAWLAEHRRSRDD